ncbi:type II toxin-antitoxin system death-on-curing family toxin [uncultured Cohaesibacter sp.]|uniref:type II toxin-antitoxin system death-on-curing family toxin n=1 Tax=uncultured Cohaesibacter sp. TaxID=1002546 RepID=UPI003749AAFE
MTEPKWNSEELFARLHECVIDIGGGVQGIREGQGLLNSALVLPQNLHAYGDVNYFQRTASYAEGIARNHPFVDGNKRTAFQWRPTERPAGTSCTLAILRDASAESIS